MSPVAAQAVATGSVDVQKLAPAVLPGTRTDFPIPADKLVVLAQQLFAAGVTPDAEAMLSDDFRFEFPVVSLDKQGYLGAVRSFDLNDALPNQESHAYDWRVDKYEPQRVWFTIRNTGTHLGTLKFNGKEFEATGKEVLGAPECLSYVFNEEGKCACFTGGYVMDRRVGNTKGLGALFGILAAIGVDMPAPGAGPSKPSEGQ